MRVALCSHQLAGFDGVSVVAGQWADALEALGHEVIEVAGSFGSRLAPTRERRPLPALWAAEPGAEPPPLENGDVRHALDGAEVVVFENVLTLASAPAAAMALADHVDVHGLPAVVHHYDPPWEHADRRTDARFPLALSGATHVATSNHVAGELAARRGIVAAVLHNPVDVAGVTGGARDATRLERGVGVGELLVVHPVGAYPRKRVDRAVDCVRRLRSMTGAPVRYWLTGADEAFLAGDPALGSLLGTLEDPPLLCRMDDVAGLYAASDLVLLTSDWEGWGMPVLEAAAAGRMPVTNPYPILAEIGGLGVTTKDCGHVERWVEQIGSPGWTATLEANRCAVAHLDTIHLAARLEPLLAAAALGPASRVHPRNAMFTAVGRC